jgi:hypothetical protein
MSQRISVPGNSHSSTNAVAQNQFILSKNPRSGSARPARSEAAELSCPDASAREPQILVCRSRD